MRKHLIGATAAATAIIGLGTFYVIAADGPSETTASIAPDTSGGSVLATGSAAASTSVVLPAGKTGPAMIRLVLEPVSVAQNEPYLVNVYVNAQGTGDQPGEKTLAGSVSFYPPPHAGEARSFLVETPATAGDPGKPLDLSVELVPANDAVALTSSSLKIVDAEVVP